MTAVDTAGIVPLAHPLDVRSRRSPLRCGAFLAAGHRMSDTEAALAQQARAADDACAPAGAPLLGVPLAHKDIFVTRDFPTTAGSQMLAATAAPSTPPWCNAWRRRPAR
jgi:Asp-tRNA(Asn)/Glu-tRNA(Gln) amidotransferase A subunit family amidase